MSHDGRDVQIMRLQNNNKNKNNNNCFAGSFWFLYGFRWMWFCCCCFSRYFVAPRLLYGTVRLSFQMVFEHTIQKDGDFPFSFFVLFSTEFGWCCCLFGHAIDCIWIQLMDFVNYFVIRFWYVGLLRTVGTDQSHRDRLVPICICCCILAAGPSHLFMWIVSFTSDLMTHAACYSLYLYFYVISYASHIDKSQPN